MAETKRVLGTALKTAPRSGVAAVGGLSSPVNIKKSADEFAPMLRDIQEQAATEAMFQKGIEYSTGQEARARSALEQVNLEGVETATKEFATTQRGLVEEAKRKEEKDPFPTFQPTQEDAMSYGQLGSMIATLGVMLGSGGKASAKVALGSMSGMMSGWQKGRKDLWEKEAKTFDKEMARMKSIREGITKDLEMGMKLAATDREASRARFAAAAHKAGSNSIIQSQLDRGQNEAALATSKSMFALEQGVKEKRRNAAAKQTERDDAERRHREDLISKGASGQSRSAGAAAGAIERMTQAMTQVSGAINSVASLPIITTGTVFGPSEFKGLFTVPLSALNNELSFETSQMLKTRMVGVARGLAALETGGAATGLVGLTQKIEEGIDIHAGTPVRVALDKLAEMRRIVEDSARAALKSSKYSESQKELIRENVQIVEKAIPFTQQDVLDSYIASKGKSLNVPKKDKNISFTDFVNNYGIGNKKPTNQPSIEPSPKAPVSTAPIIKKEKAGPEEVVHRDKDGNKAVKRNGTWVEVE